MKRLTIHFGLALTLGLGLVAALLWLAKGGEVAAGAASPHSPAAAGNIITVCLDGGCDYTSVQAAVDAANDGDVIKVAEGVYADISARLAPDDYYSPNPNVRPITQVVYISKTITIQGGYTTTNWSIPYPLTQPTTLDAREQGRVLFIVGNISPMIEGLRITGGNADGLGGWWNNSGGGIYVLTATAVISGNEIFSNTADSGGGVFISRSAAVLNHNGIYSNTASRQGGGVAIISKSSPMLSGNLVMHNVAGVNGGGIYVHNMDIEGEKEASLIGNTIANNQSDAGGGVSAEWGKMRFQDNEIINNTASDGAGGVSVHQATGPIVFANDVIAFNVGRGVEASEATCQFVNAIVANNAGGLSVSAVHLHLIHTTIARNVWRDGVGVEVQSSDSGYSIVAVTNTILASHTVGISVTSGNTVTVNGILWDPETPITVSQGVTAVVMIQNQYTGDPAFAVDGYHLTAGSAARDRGVHAGIETDIDGEPRPVGTGYDIGADEFSVAMEVSKQADPNPVRAGARLNYTICITNTGNVDLHAVITDVLPAHVTPAGVLTWVATIPAPKGVWVQMIPVTVEMGYAGSLTNVVQVTTQEGATGIYTVTSIAQVTPSLGVSKSAEPDSVQVGARLTYTIHVTNTGNVDLHAIITDTLPEHVMPGGILTWTPSVTAPGGVWVQTIVITVETGYVGPLTNTVRVSTLEGAAGETIVVVNSVPRRIFLPLVLRNF